jgi:hypothetical protein
MPEPRLIIKKRPRAEYEIGTFTDDGAIVARVSVWDESRPDGRTDLRTEDEKEEEALERAKRLVVALQETLAGS